MFKPRPAQKEILKYTCGRMGISAVPGSGKTHTLSALAAQIIHAGSLAEDQEVLVVTLVNSAVANFTQRVESFLKDSGTLPGFQYRVRTLHGLANDIVSERPSIAGLANDYAILDERDTTQIISAAATAWYRSHVEQVEAYLAPDIGQSQMWKVRKEHLPRLLRELSVAFIRTVKDKQLTEEQVVEIAEQARETDGFHALYMCASIYGEYQRALHYRGAVDFDDLIRLALAALRQDDQLLARLRQRWPFILEDEAQDSSLLQQEILALLSGGSGNWVRVGDPNQAIYATFTTANPRFLCEFMQTTGVTPRDLPESGRSTQSIINLANHIITWTREQHPLPSARTALDLPLIQPVLPGDANPNPDDAASIIRLLDRKQEPEEELLRVADSLEEWLKHNSDKTVAVLSSLNRHLEKMSELLKARGIPAIELLRSTSATRRTAGQLDSVLRFLANPREANHLASAFTAWRTAALNNEELGDDDTTAAAWLRKCTHTEDYLYPQLRDWLTDQPLEDSPQVENLLNAFRAAARTWLDAASLPIDELVIFLASELFIQPADLAVAHKIAALLRSAAVLNPEWRLPDFSHEAAEYTTMERKFTGFSDEDAGFDPALHKGRVVLATIHKAKGLEWDRVYLTALNNYDFPSGAEGDEYMSERWFLKDRLNLQAEVLAQLDLALANQLDSYIEGQAARKDRLHYINERLRVLYVGVTRARSELLLSWNTGLQKRSTEALALTEIKDYLIQNGIISARREP